jgi:hypothetical protein
VGARVIVRRLVKRTVLRLGVTLVLAGVTVVWLCQPSGAAGASTWSLSKSVIASGGGTSSTSQWTLSDTAGQPVVGTTAGSSTTLSAGFWAGGKAVTITGRTVYLPAVRR